MVAGHSSIASRFVQPPEWINARRWSLVQFTRADAAAMTRIGIIPEDATTELLNGMIVLVDRSARGENVVGVGSAHVSCVEHLSDLRGRINNEHRHVRSQQPLVCSDIHEPLPDFMILRGKLGDYADLPTAADSWCVVEVADSSYERDAGEKLAGYARAGVKQYVIINLRNKTAEQYTDPDMGAGFYASKEIIGAGQMLALRVGEAEFYTVALADVLA